MLQSSKLQQVWFYIGLVWIAIIVYLSLVEKASSPGNVSDKFLHFIVYWFICNWYLIISPTFKEAYIYVGSFIALGIILEVLQISVPGRFFSVADMVSNCLGILFALLLTKYIFMLRKAISLKISKVFMS